MLSLGFCESGDRVFEVRIRGSVRFHALKRGLEVGLEARRLHVEVLVNGLVHEPIQWGSPNVAQELQSSLELRLETKCRRPTLESRLRSDGGASRTSAGLALHDQDDSRMEF